MVGGGHAVGIGNGRGEKGGDGAGLTCKRFPSMMTEMKEFGYLVSNFGTGCWVSKYCARSSEVAKKRGIVSEVLDLVEMVVVVCGTVDRNSIASHTFRTVTEVIKK